VRYCQHCINCDMSEMDYPCNVCSQYTEDLSDMLFFVNRELLTAGSTDVEIPGRSCHNCKHTKTNCIEFPCSDCSTNPHVIGSNTTKWEPRSSTGISRSCYDCKHEALLSGDDYPCSHCAYLHGPILGKSIQWEPKAKEYISFPCDGCTAQEELEASGACKHCSDNPVKEEESSDGVPMGAPGCKVDKGKPKLSFAIDGFPLALRAIAMVGQIGHEVKGYGLNSWKSVADGEGRYHEARYRHRSKINEGEYLDEGDGGTGCPHIFLEAWNMLAELQLHIEAHPEVMEFLKGKK